jgi:hypothetical protein
MCIVADPVVADTLLRVDNAPKALEASMHMWTILGQKSMAMAEVSCPTLDF